MIQIEPQQAPSQVGALFDPALPASVRCFNVLAGNLGGQILVDDRLNPVRAVVRESAYGTTFLGGSFDRLLLAQIIPELRQNGEVVLLLLPDDRHIPLLPAPEYDGYAIDFTARPIGEALDASLSVPDGCQIRRVDSTLFERSLDRDANIATFGSIKNALEKWIGFFLMRGDDILCEASAGPPAMGIVELGVATPLAHLRRGYATVTCAHLIRMCESMGYQTYWNAAKQNLASVALARKLGYRREVEHRVLAWFKS